MNGVEVFREAAENARVAAKIAFEKLKEAAEQGFAKAQYVLGICYKNGGDVEQNFVKAVEWLEKAAEQGDAKACFHLGICYEKGLGVKKDLKKAGGWYRRSQNGSID